MELFLRKIVTSDTQLLCMGNLPPLFIRDGKLTVFVQNYYLVNKAALEGFSIFIRNRIRFERWWLKFTASKVKRFIVQTETMAVLLKKSLCREADVFPFVDLTIVDSTELICNHSETKFDFLYVASGEPHKNHAQLILAWVALAKLNHFPRLCLTIDKQLFPDLCEWIETRVGKYHLKVELISGLPPKEIQLLYKKTRALIYPSKFESFGLPLLEAVNVGMPVLASDSSYVYDVINPSMVFDPDSSESIAASVIAFTYQRASFSGIFYNSQEFLSDVFELDN